MTCVHVCREVNLHIPCCLNILELYTIKKTGTCVSVSETYKIVQNAEKNGNYEDDMGIYEDNKEIFCHLFDVASTMRVKNLFRYCFN